MMTVSNCTRKLGYILFAAFAAIVLLTPGCGDDMPADQEFATVRRADFELKIIEKCEFKPLNSWTVLAAVSDKIEWLITEGTHVKPGDKVFTLDRTIKTEWLNRDTNELDAARKNLAEAQQQIAMEREEVLTSIRAKEASVRMARMRLLTVCSPAPVEKLTEARAFLSAAQATAKDAAAKELSAQQLGKDGYISQAQVDKAGLTARIAAINQVRRSIQLKQLEKGADKYARQIAKLELARAVAELEVAQASSDKRNANLSGRLSNEKQRVASLQASVARAQRSLKQRISLANGSGVIIYRKMGWRRKTKPEVGTRVWPGAGVVDIADLSKMKIRTQIPERYIRYLKPGSSITTIPNALSKKSFPAKVIWIDRWSRDRSADLAEADRKREGLSGVKIFAIEACLTSNDPRIKPGFKGTAQFNLLTVKDALIVPLSAVFGQQKSRFVLALEKGIRNKIPITVLADDGKNAAVAGKLKSGLCLLNRGQQ
jgi:multidrug resistance efflux pump